MKSFYEFINLLSEAPTPPTSPPPKGGSPTSSPTSITGGTSGSSSLGASLGGLGGPPSGLGGLGGPSGGPAISPDSAGVMADIGGQPGAQSGPVKVQKVKTLDVWSALQKIAKNTNLDSEQSK